MSSKDGPMMRPMGAMGAMALGRQKMQETQYEKQQRIAGKFPEIEAALPVLRSRRGASLIDKLSALLGERNPLARPVSPRDHAVWLLDTTAWRGQGKDDWTCEVVAAYFVKGSGQDSSAVVAKISELVGLAEDDAARQEVARRLGPFLDCVLPAHTAQLEIDNQTFKLGPSSTEGLTSDIVHFKSKAKGGFTISPQLVGMASEQPMTAFFAEPEGWAVISDVDDTIKKTMTSSALGVLKTTFVDEPQAIEGMPELYHHIKKTFNNPPFWYLSASPYNLYPFLRQFQESFDFPRGQLILRDASWMSLAGLLASVTQGTQAYKVDRIKKVNSWFPQRKFICVGDSTQSDPEAYGEAYRAHPDWIKAIFIRKVTDVVEIGKDPDEKNKAERFEKAFKDVPKDIWYVFTDPKQLYTRLDMLSK